MLVRKVLFTSPRALPKTLLSKTLTRPFVKTIIDTSGKRLNHEDAKETIASARTINEQRDLIDAQRGLIDEQRRLIEALKVQNGAREAPDYVVVAGAILIVTVVCSVI